MRLNKYFLLIAGILTMWSASATAQIYEFTTIAGAVTITGSADGANRATRFNHPAGIAVDTTGNLYVADESNYTIRRVTLVDTNWVTTTIAGSAGSPHGSPDGTNSAAQFYNPCGVTVDTNGNLYVADTYNRTIRKIAPVGTKLGDHHHCGAGGVIWPRRWHK